jgi:glycosyltransferase involved in cell wall biosynthesis
VRIAHFADAYFPMIDGTVTFLDGLVRNLNARGHRTVLIVPGQHKRPSRRVEDDVLRLGSLPFKFAPQGYRATWEPATRVRSRLRDLDFDLVHIHSPFAAARLGLSFASERKLPTVLTYHTLFPAYAALYGPRWGTHLWERVLTRRSRQVANRCDLVIANSRPMVPVLVSYGISTQIQTIPVGINHDVFAQARPTGKIRDRFGIKAGSKVILYVGRIGLEKSVELMVPMLRALQDRFDSHLILCGQGNQEAALKRASVSLGISQRIHYAGVIRDPRELALFYGDADVFVFPSQTDTFGLVVVEAQAAGLPVVAVGVLGSTATIQDGVTGLLSSPDPIQLANQVSRILSDPTLARRLRAGARRNALAYTADSIAARHVEAYRNVVGGRVAAAVA